MKLEFRKKFIVMCAVFLFSVNLYSENLYMNFQQEKTNSSANAFDNYSEFGGFYNFEIENSGLYFKTPFLFTNLYFGSEYNKKHEELVSFFSASMNMGPYFSLGGSYLNYKSESVGDLSMMIRSPWLYLGYKYTINSDILKDLSTDFDDYGYFINKSFSKHEINLAMLFFDKFSPFVNIRQFNLEDEKLKNWTFDTGISILNLYGFDLSYTFTRKWDEEKIHQFNVKINTSNFSLGITSFDKKAGTIYASVKSKINKSNLYEKSNYWMKIKLDGPLSEIGTGGILDGSDYTFIDLLTIVKKAMKDTYIKGILFEIDKPTLTSSQAEELLNILNKEKKQFRVYLNMNSLGDYLLASSANMSAIHPAVELDIKGPSVTMMFFKMLFQLAGVEAQFFKRAEHKTAPEMFTNMAPSEYSISQVDKIFTKVKSFVENIIKKNKALTSNITELLDNAPYSPKRAVKLALIDNVSYLDEFEKNLENMGVELISPSLYNSMFLKDLKVSSKNRIAVLAIEGEIVETKGVMFGISENYRKKILNSIEEIRKNPFISGVIVRVNSPGGSGFVSDEINHALKVLKKVKPVYISIGAMSASGGYYISVAGEKVFANKMSIVGSIGAYTGKFVILNLVKRFMVGVFTKSIWKNGNLSSMFSSLNETQVKKMEESIEDFYLLFLERVKEGRNISIEKLKAEIAGGRIYMGEESKDLELIDEIGGFYDTLDKLIADKSLSGNLILEAYPKSNNFLLNLFSMEKKLLFKLNTMINLIKTPNLLLSDYEFEF